MAPAARLTKRSKNTARRVKGPLAMHKRGAKGTSVHYLDRATAAQRMPRGASPHFLATFADEHGATHHRWVPYTTRFSSLFVHSCEALEHKLGWRLVEQGAAEGEAAASEGDEFEAAILFLLSLPCSLPQKAVAFMLGVGVKGLHKRLKKYYTVNQEDANELWPAVLEALPAGQLQRRDADAAHSLASGSAADTLNDSYDESELRSGSNGRSTATRMRRVSGALGARSAGVRKSAASASKRSVSSAATSIQYTVLACSSGAIPPISPQPAAAWPLPEVDWPRLLSGPVPAGSLSEAEEAALSLLGDDQAGGLPLDACWEVLEAEAGTGEGHPPPSPSLSAMSGTGSSADFARLLAMPSCNLGDGAGTQHADSEDLLSMLLGPENDDDWLAEFAAGQGLNGDAAAEACTQAPTAVAAHQLAELDAGHPRLEAWLAAPEPASWAPAWTAHPAAATGLHASAAASTLLPRSGHSSQLESSGTAVAAAHSDWTTPLRLI